MQNGKKRCLELADILGCDKEQHAVMVRSVNTFTEDEAVRVAYGLDHVLKLASEFINRLEKRANKRKRKNGTKRKIKKTP